MVHAVDLSRVRADWDTFGKRDPLWAVLKQEGKKGGRWDEGEFFATGVEEIARLMDLVAERNRPIARDAALDFGCGVGRLTQALGNYFGAVVGVDIAPSMLEAAERYNSRPNCRFVLNERPDLSIFESGTFDLIYSNIVLQHMPPEAAKGYLAEFARVLKAGGLAVFSVPSSPSKTLRGTLYRVLPRPLIYAYKRRRDGALMAMNAVPMEELVPLVTRIGLRVELVQPDESPGPHWNGFRYVLSKDLTPDGPKNGDIA
jgi:SAM-dependent methyltransferase